MPKELFDCLHCDNKTNNLNFVCDDCDRDDWDCSYCRDDDHENCKRPDGEHCCCCD